MNNNLQQIMILAGQLDEKIKLLPEMEAKLNKQLSILDRAKSDILHDIELKNLNAVELSRCTKELRKVLRLRRLVKNDLLMLNSLKGSKKEWKSPGVLHKVAVNQNVKIKQLVYTQRISKRALKKTCNEIIELSNECERQEVKQVV